MENKEYTPEEIEQAKQKLIAANQDKINRVSKKLAELLEAEKCRLDISMLVTGQGCVPQLRIVPQD